jgi:Holliday junction resolvase-like predicted endonuclease
MPRVGYRRHVEDFQALASQQGKAFEEAVETILLTNGCTVVARKYKDPVSREEVDLVVDTPGGQRVWIECKGSWNPRKNQEGMRRSDTAKKAVATAWHLRYAHGSDMPPYLLVTSHLPKPGNYSESLVSAAVEDGLFCGLVTYTDLPAWLSEIDRTAPDDSVTRSGDDG